ncbi:MAG: hypothetical protein L6244_00435 [Candidatus Methanoperedenaceae archaeon]|nr:hypothetical protein [Candidatus Methanoperedenaceae archaeon]
MTDWSWDTKSHKGIRTDRQGIKKLPEEWLWEPVKMGPAHSSYGRGVVGKILTEKVYDCGFCRGTGERPKGSRCPVCNGKGTVSVSPPAVVCAYCKGGGEDKPRSNITCTACRGKGIISVQEPVEICSHCNGKGREPNNKLPCGACKGSGVVTVKQRVETQSVRRESIRYPSFNIQEYSSDEKEQKINFPTGSERDALKIITELGCAGRVTVGKRMGVSSTYAEMVCGSLCKKGLITKGEGRIYYPTAKGETAIGHNSKVNRCD